MRERVTSLTVLKADMTHGNLLSRLLPPGQPWGKVLRVLVLHDGQAAQQRVERLLVRIGRNVPTMTITSRYCLLQGSYAAISTKKAELLIIAAGCMATQSQDVLERILPLLQRLKRRDGALAFLYGTDVPRLMESMLFESWLSKASELAGISFFSGTMPGVGCPGCNGGSRGRTTGIALKQFCVLHSPTRPSLARELPEKRGTRSSRFSRACL